MDTESDYAIFVNTTLLTLNQDAHMLVFANLDLESLVHCQRVCRSFKFVADQYLGSSQQNVWKAATLVLRPPLSDDSSITDWKLQYLKLRYHEHELERSDNQTIVDRENRHLARTQFYLQRSAFCWGIILFCLGVAFLPDGIINIRNLAACTEFECTVLAATMSCVDNYCYVEWSVDVDESPTKPNSTIDITTHTWNGFAPPAITQDQIRDYLTEKPEGYHGGCFYCPATTSWYWQIEYSAAIAEIAIGAFLIILLLFCCINLWSVNWK